MCSKTILVLILATHSNPNYRIAKSIAENICYYSQRQDLDPYLVLGLIRHESNFITTVMSKSNDYGLMQINIRYRRYRCRLFEIECNIKEGTKYMAIWKRACLVGHNHKRSTHWLKHYNWNSPNHHLKVLWLTEAYRRGTPRLLWMIKKRRYTKLKLNYACIRDDLCGADPKPKEDVENVVGKERQNAVGHL